MDRKKVVLIIRDGMGINPSTEHNAVAAAHTPVNDSLLANNPHTVLIPSGSSVGLPEGYQGSSEVGHLNMGAGRIVKQEITRINESLADGSFFKSGNYQRAINNCKEKGSALHIMGLVQDEGVHAHQDHLYAIMDHASKEGIKSIWIHFFGDGRDTPPRSSMGFLKKLRMKMSVNCSIATLMGRYYSMDRGRNWPLTDMAYEALVEAKGTYYENPEDAIEQSYKMLKNPDGSDMTDEYIPPCIMAGYGGIKDGDSVVHFNYRQDRAIQLTKAFVEDDYPGTRKRRPEIVYCGLTKYYDSFSFNILAAMDEGPGMTNILGEVISASGMKQLRIAETQKFNHVTSFMNGKRIEPFPGEERIEVNTKFDPSKFADHPEMSAYEVAETTADKVRSAQFALVVVNFANCDMVGHTGNFDSTVKAVEKVDECVGKVLEAVRETGAVALVTADHGNAEEMFDPEIKEPKTAHTTNPVHLFYIGDDAGDVRLKDGGILADIAPTILYLLDIEVPPEMTAENLIRT
ncbi:MAG: 2,3-bisphosphoglycerate-independent phosphoglycerate mutase [Thermodesulfovibrionales bacterium]|nr:2,3-bisphosphoglycerate-independent phosphoglycerate mutase [Thermodesulfovibrionales bacterium]